MKSISFLQFFLALLMVMLCSATPQRVYAQSSKVTISRNKATVKQVLADIEKQTNYLFIYGQDVNVDRTVSVDAKKMSVSKVLNKVFKGEGVKYTLRGNHIVLTRTSSSTPNQSTAKSGGQPKQAIQKKHVQGRVVDENGEPMIGVTITSNGQPVAVTDANGNYSIAAVDPSSSISFSYVGYLDKQISVANGSRFNVTMNEDRAQLDEVVVVGYGTMKKRDLTGSVSSISNDAITSNPVADVGQAIQGKLAGVSVTVQDGRPGANMDIRVRGGGSVTQSNAPLYIVDGTPVSSLSDIPASQIKSIDVLKDASSTAIYGARGANGVILVTTYGTDFQKSSITYEGYMQIKSAAKTYDVLDAQDYILHNWSYATALGKSYQNGVESYFGLGSDNGNHYNEYAGVKAHDYTDDLLRTVVTQSHNLTINGYGDKTKYIVMANFIGDPGIKINSSYNRVNATFKLTHQLFSNLKLGFDFRFRQSNLKGYETSTTLSKAFMYRPIDNPLGTGNFAGFGNGDINVDPSYNPVDVTNSYKNLTKSNMVTGLVNATWNIFKGLTLREEFSIDGSWGYTRNYNNGETSASTFKYGEQRKADGYGWRNTLTLTYDVQGLGKNHSLSVLAGNENLYSRSNYDRIYGSGYVASFDYDRVFGMINMTDGTRDAFGNTIGTPNITHSWFGRVNYSYLDRYLLTATFRADGSSKFTSNNRWGFFPAAAFAWRIIDEPWMEQARSWIDNLKLRLSYGTSGSDNISSQLWEETWTSGTLLWNNETKTTYAPAGMKSNPDLKWETTISRNLGFDFAFLKGRLNGSLDLYWNTTKDLLIYVPIDASTGYTYQYQNVGKTSNKGVELALNYDIYRTKDFDINMSLTYNYNHNNIDELNENVSTLYSTNWASSSLRPSDDYEFRVGEPVGLVRGFVYDGFYTLDDFNVTQQDGKWVYSLKPGVIDMNNDLVGRYYGQGNFTTDGCAAFPGAIKLKDTNDDGTIDDKDVVDLGHITPEHTGGFNINLRYKNWDFSAGFTYALGGHVYNALAMSSMQGNVDVGIGSNKLAFMKDTYKIYDVNANGDIEAVTDPSKLAQINAGAKYALPYYERGLVLSNWFEDASYLRCSTLTLGYTLPKSLISKIKLSDMRIYATAGNLFVLTGYSGLDPEVNSMASRGGFPTIGLDYYTYPRARTFTFGIKVTL